MGDDGRAQLSTRVADTLLGTKESWTRRMFEQAAQLRRQGGGPVHDLSLGNPSLEPPGRWTTAMHELLDDPTPGMHRYMTNAGFLDVREFIAGREAERFGLPVEAGQVTMTVGAAGGLNVILHSMLDPGDEVLVPLPYFTEYDHYCANAGATLVTAPCTETFALDVEAIELDEDALIDEQRLVVTDIGRATAQAFVSDDAVSKAAKHEVVFEPGKVRVRYKGKDVEAKASVKGRLMMLSTNLPGVPPMVLPLPSSDLIPCSPELELLAGKARLSCSIDELPAKLREAMAQQ
ncbi:MAG: aminotransferase class I/II-fold pyridoxal phosphate-dependent enzyme [Myxococcales bacterium]|nr:aminotransferase class I/II-fold pyridoxal phosphate-dependent enzyme [Myxococcales bacterium]